MFWILNSKILLTIKKEILNDEIYQNLDFSWICILLLVACGQGGGGAGSKKSKTLDNTKKAGFVKCGVSQGLPGFSNADASGNWSGIDVDVCRAVAAACLLYTSDAADD